MTERLAEKSTPYWWEAAPVAPLPTAHLPKQADVVVVGAGFAGLTAALTLVRAGRSVVVIDKMNPGEGASSRNGGITSGNIRPSYASLKRNFGEEKALAIEAEGKIAREFLYELIASERLDCDFQLTGKFGGSIGAEQYEANARSADELRRKLGIEAWAVPRSEQKQYIGSDFYRGGYVRMDIGGVHPAKMHAELLRVTMAAGVTVLSGVAVQNIVAQTGGQQVTTSSGTIIGRQVLVCTNGYTDGALPWLRRRLIPVRSRIIATKPLSTEVMDRLMPKRMMMSEGLILGHYYRPSPDGTRIILGGRDSSFKGDPTAPTLLMKKGLARIFPELEGIGLSHSWFGNVAMNRDMLPRLFEHKGLTFATGFCGSGVVWAPWLGSRAALKLLNENRAESPFEFRPPAAVPFYNGNPYFMPAVIHGYRIQDRRAMARATR